MELSPEQLKTFDNLLSAAMTEDEAHRFRDIDYDIRALILGELCWQAPYALGMVATVFEAPAIGELADRAAPPLEEWLEVLGSGTADNEQARILLHTRFALGLLLAGRDKERSRTLLCEMAATELAVRGSIVRSPGLACTPDVSGAKTHAALHAYQAYVSGANARGGPIPPHLAAEAVDQDRRDCAALVFLLTEATACRSSANEVTRLLLQIISGLLDDWAEKCDQEDASLDNDFPTLGWLDLFSSVGELLSLCQETDSSDVSPSECLPHSAQRLGWQFGRIAARLVGPQSRWREDAVGQLRLLARDGDWHESFHWQRGPGRAFGGLMAAMSLLCEHGPGRDWHRAREAYLGIWRLCNSYAGLPLDKITPQTDLYWAMRIGFADKVLEQEPPGMGSRPPEGISAVMSELKIIRAVVEMAALVKVRQRQDSEKGLATKPVVERDIYEDLAKVMGPILEQLSPDISDELTKAEAFFRGDSTEKEAKLCFSRAVEGCLLHTFVEPLLGFVEQRGIVGLKLRFSRQAVAWKSCAEVKRLLVVNWADALDAFWLADERMRLATPEFWEFTKAHFGGAHLPELAPLPGSLREVHWLRAEVSHHTLRQSRAELEQMRRLVLGIGRESVLGQICRLLGRRIKA